MWVVVWDEDTVDGPFATKAQAREYVEIDRMVHGEPFPFDDFIVKVRTPNTPGYDRDLTLHGLMIRDD